MGGKALKNTFTERKSTKDFIFLSNEIIPIFREKLGTDIHLVKCYRTKRDHGDMDLLVKITSDLHNRGIDIKTFVYEEFRPNEIFNNNGIISFDYKQFQIDLILIKESDWEVSKTFFDYDPTGNLMGKTAYKFGCKYGFDGLVYPYRNFNGRISKNIVLSKDNRTIFNFLGYDYDRYLQGFDTIIDIFEYVINSNFFDYKNFLPENLNHIDRKRNSKRLSYNQFMKYLDDNDIRKEYHFDKNKENYLDFIDEHFPDIKIKEQVKNLKLKNVDDKLIHEKFNGKLIMMIYPNLKGEQLGKVINGFEKSFDNFREYVLNNSTEQIMKDFVSYYEKKREN